MTAATASKAAAKATKPIHVFRGILRHLKTELPPELARKATPEGVSATATRDFVIQQYRVSQHISTQEEITELRQLAADYLALRNDLKERARLYELDSGAESVLSPKEMSRRAAARAGLQLPDLNPELK